MSKRFIDTELFNDSWFMDLSPNGKLFFIYLITNCDQAGIIDLNNRLAEFQIGIEGLANSYQTLFEQFGEKRIIHLEENYYFMPNFIRYQYPNGLNTNVKAHQSVIDKLTVFDINIQTLSKQLGNSLITVQDKDIYKDKDKDILKGGMGGKPKSNPNCATLESNQVFDVADYFNFTEISHPDKISQIAMFLNVLIADGNLSHFEEQFAAYKSYKEKSKEIKHHFPRFIGTIEKRYLDGGWNQENWVHKLSTVNGGKQSVAEHNKAAKAEILRKINAG